MDFSSFAMPPDHLAKADFVTDAPDLAMSPNSLATVETPLLQSFPIVVAMPA